MLISVFHRLPYRVRKENKMCAARYSATPVNSMKPWFDISARSLPGYLRCQKQARIKFIEVIDRSHTRGYAMALAMTEHDADSIRRIGSIAQVHRAPTIPRPEPGPRSAD